MKQSVYEKITARIVADLEQGVRPWMKPWNAEHAAGRITRPLRSNGVPYRGINIVMLWMTAMERGYTAPIWMTFKQALEHGGCVRKGEHGALVVYADTITRSETSESGEESESVIPFMKGYTAFNVEQIEGLPERFHALAHEPALDAIARIARADAFFAATGANVITGGNMACYASGPDHIRMPPFETFRDAESYYATLAHEQIHWTRHPSRLDRDLGRKRWGDEGYAAEELVAELGAAFVCADLALTPEVRDDHAAYIASWLKVLKNDPRAIFTAASHAQRAADYLGAFSATAAAAA